MMPDSKQATNDLPADLAADCSKWKDFRQVAQQVSGVALEFAETGRPHSLMHRRQIRKDYSWP